MNTEKSPISHIIVTAVRNPAPFMGEIQRLLGNGEPMLSAELEQRVIDATGCHAQTIKAAKKDLGVESFQSGQKLYSSLPGQSTKNSQSTINSGSAETP